MPENGFNSGYNNLDASAAESAVEKASTETRQSLFEVLEARTSQMRKNVVHGAHAVNNISASIGAFVGGVRNIFTGAPEGYRESQNKNQAL